MQVVKTILAVAVIFLAITGIVLCSVGIFYSWALNIPVTETLVATTESVEKVLTGVGNGLNRIDEGIVGTRSAVNRIDGAVRAAGETIVNTDLAFEILERTVGDELFPLVISARETALALAETVVAVNTTLESANQLPFVSVPTLTDELQQVASFLGDVRTTVDEIRSEAQMMKKEAVGRPVAFFTTRTGTMIDNLDSAADQLAATQANVNRALAATGAAKAGIPRTIDLISIAATLVLAWFIIAQICLLVHSWRSLRHASSI